MTGTPDAGERDDAAPIRILIVDDHEMFAASLSKILTDEPDLDVVDEVGTLKAALDVAAVAKPDVILLDQRLPDGDGIDIIGRLLDIEPAPQVVMLTASTADHVLIAAMEAGAAGFIDKTRSLSDVMAAVRSAAAGEALVSPRLLARLLPRLRRHEADPMWSLTEREREVLRCLAEGQSNAEIAKTMTLSVHTVRNHVANLSTKLGAHSKLEVLAIAIREGLVHT